jgi:hypothetical protein
VDALPYYLQSIRVAIATAEIKSGIVSGSSSLHGCEPKIDGKRKEEEGESKIASLCSKEGVCALIDKKCSFVSWKLTRSISVERPQIDVSPGAKTPQRQARVHGNGGH